MKIAAICDMHLSEYESAPQYDYFYQAIEYLKNSDVDMVVTMGDMTACGAENAFRIYREKIEELSNHITISGNADVRTENAELLAYAQGGEIECGRRVLCINTPFSKIEEDDFAKIQSLSDGDVIMMHHSLAGLTQEVRERLKAILNSKKLILIHAHSHKFSDSMVGKSRVICVKALDPDKCIGTPPSITIFEMDKDKFDFSEKCFSASKETIKDLRDYLGICCFDLDETIDYAIANGVKNLELKVFSEDTTDISAVQKKIEQFRAHGGKVLSMHMPNLRFDGENIVDKGWDFAIKLAKATGVESFTIHPPRISVALMREKADIFIDYLCDFIKQFPDAKFGIENLHMNKNDVPDDTRGYGMIPEETLAFVDAINKQLGEKKCGCLLDVGHAVNNRSYTGRFPLSAWYALVGNRTVAYHIHQVKRTDDNVLHNHRELDEWFGPMISYSSFFWSWRNGLINKCPVFFEMRKFDDVKTSLKAFEALEEI